ncbi:hypothetical protein [Lacticaseibacillus jixiensis]|uniref:hypothetical protein n=1 Tax=Lacticaseibacillus jixiensis TaxID=3231926 RepID=UPI0036F3A385
MSRYDIDFYRDSDGYSDFEEYLDGLLESTDKTEKATAKKLRYQLGLLAEAGTALRLPQVAELKRYKHKLFETRRFAHRLGSGALPLDQSLICLT